MSHDKLDDILDIVPEPDSTELVPVTPLDDTAIDAIPVTLPSEAIQEDFETVRANLRDLIVKGTAAFDSALMLAQAGDAPKAYEVVGKVLDSLVNANESLLEAHTRRREAIGETSTPTNNVNIGKAVFVGTTTNLLKEIKAAANALKESAAPKT